MSSGTAQYKKSALRLLELLLSLKNCTVLSVTGFARGPASVYSDVWSWGLPLDQPLPQCGRCEQTLDSETQLQIRALERSCCVALEHFQANLCSPTTHPAELQRHPEPP